MLAACFPGFELNPGLVWGWALPLMLALWLGGRDTKRKRYGFRTGWFCGFVFWMINLKWLLAMGDLDTVPALGAFFGLCCLSAYLAIYFGIWAAVVASIGNPWRKPSPNHHNKPLSSLEKKVISKQEAQKKPSVYGGWATSFRIIQFALLHASLWVSLEWCRGWIMTGFGWNGLGVAFHEVLVMAQMADVIGVTGLSFFPILIASVMLQTGKRLIGEARVGKFTPHWEIGFSVGLVAITFAYGVNRLAYFSRLPGHDVQVLLVQENISQKMKWDEEQRAIHYQGYLDSTRAALKEIEDDNMARLQKAIDEGGDTKIHYPDLVIFPESALTQELLYLSDEPGVFLLPLNDALLRHNLLKSEHFHLAFGANLVPGKEYANGISYDPEGKLYNALAIASPELAKVDQFPTTAIQTRGKNHLVPFGEYIPEIPFLDTIFEMSSGMSFGANFSSSDCFDPMEIELRGETIQIIPSVCFEDTVGRLTRRFVRSAPQMIVNITNDGWFGESEAAQQQLANAKFRTIELRRPLARAANTGVSALVDITGSTLDPITGKNNVILDDQGRPFVRDTLFGTIRIPFATTWSIYALAGDWFILVCALCSIGLILWFARKS